MRIHVTAHASPRARACLLFLLALLLPLRALADDPPPDALVRDGIALFQRGDYPAARDTFSRAYARAPRPATLLDLALAELAAHAPLDALRHFRAYVDDPHASPEAAARVRAKMIPRALAETGHILVTAPPGATLGVDGARNAVGTVDVMPGQHALELRSGSVTTHVTLVAPAGELLRIELDAPAPAPAAPAPAAPAAPTPASRAAAPPAPHPPAR